MFMDYKLDISRRFLLKRNNYKALVLGAGGVAPSIIFALIKSKVADITLSNRTYEKSIYFKKNFQKLS